MDRGSGSTSIKVGDIEAGFKEADTVVEAEYFAPYLAHATMEPMNAAAWVQDDMCDVWSPNQGPTLVRNQAAKITGLARSKVNVHTTKYLGGGFGRRSTRTIPRKPSKFQKKLKHPSKSFGREKMTPNFLLCAPSACTK